MTRDSTERISLGELHGAILTAKVDGERKPLVGFECDDWPECETCGHLDKELIRDSDEGSVRGGSLTEGEGRRSICLDNR